MLKTHYSNRIFLIIIENIVKLDLSRKIFLLIYGKIMMIAL